MPAYYNEHDPYAAQWLRNLIAAGHIAPGDVDERSIVDVRADDLRGYEQCHFFAGIGGWSLALRMAGWDDARPVWTGSCPCQPFSVAGKGKAQNDERHLWPVWFDLIKQVRPSILFGEQVAGAITHGWLDDAFDDLESEGYETAACVLPACSVGAPHKRDRLWFMAHAQCEGERRWGIPRPGEDIEALGSWPPGKPIGTGEIMANGESPECERQRAEPDRQPGGFANSSIIIPDTISERGCGRISERQDAKDAGKPSRRAEYGFWDIEPPLGRVANGIPARVGKLRALGNAIVPQVAAEFIKATM